MTNVSSTVARPRRLVDRLVPPANRFHVVAWAWSSFWLIFLVPHVFAAFSSGDPRQLTGGVGLLLIAASYLTAMRFAFEGFQRGGRARPLPATLCLLGILAGMLLAWSGLRGVAFNGLPYLAVSATMLYRLPWAALVNLSAVAAAWAGEHYLPSDATSGLVVSVAISAAATGAGIFGIRRSFDARAAQAEAARLSIQDARNKMARDLHDILGHSLTVITVKAELAQRLVDLDPERAKVELADLEQLSRNALADVRRTVTGYREISLSGELARAREALRAADIVPDLPRQVDEVPGDLRELFAWAVREATTNILRHSGATRCSITLSPNAIRVLDNGRGNPSSLPGNGLVGLQERAAAAGAVVHVRTPRPGQSRPGFELTVSALPAGPSAAGHDPELEPPAESTPRPTHATSCADGPTTTPDTATPDTATPATTHAATGATRKA